MKVTALYLDGVATLRESDKPAIDCLMTTYEPLVYDTLCEFLGDGSRVAEIGCFKAGSAAVLTRGMQKRGKSLALFCHDLFEPFEINGIVHDIEGTFDENVATWGLNVSKIRGDSKITHAEHEDGTLDYVFVDGDHSYEGALADVLNFAPKLKDDGWMFVQDCKEDVASAVEDGLSSEFVKCLIFPPVGHYIVVANRDARKIEEFGEKLKTVIDKIAKDVVMTDEEASYELA
jgi:hypothetical protein